MRIVIFASLFASVIYAQSSMTYLNLMWPAEPTLTLISSDATATTYEKNCLSDDTRVTTDLFRPWSSGDTYRPRSSWAPANSSMQASTSTQLPVTTPTAEAESCVPFTLFQGPETWGFDLSEPHAGGTQLTGRCTWNGAFTAAKLKCTSGRNMGTTEFIGQEALRTTENAFAVATLVKAETTATARATKSSGLAVGIARPTGVVAMVGGAAAIGAAAWAY